MVGYYQVTLDKIFKCHVANVQQVCQQYLYLLAALSLWPNISRSLNNSDYTIRVKIPDNSQLF